MLFLGNFRESSAFRFPLTFCQCKLTALHRLIVIFFVRWIASSLSIRLASPRVRFTASSQDKLDTSDVGLTLD